MTNNQIDNLVNLLDGYASKGWPSSKCKRSH